KGGSFFNHRPSRALVSQLEARHIFLLKGCAQSVHHRAHWLSPALYLLTPPPDSPALRPQARTVKGGSKAFHRPILNDIEANVSALEIDEIKKRLEPLMKGCRIESPVFDPGAFLYRARRITPSFCKQIGIDRSSLIYPPREVAALGRMNRPGESVFYASL